MIRFAIFRLNRPELPAAWATRTLLVTALLCATFGCGGPDRPATVPVAGKVTFDHGPPPTSGTLYFSATPNATGATQRPGSAEFAADGAFQARSFENAPGLLPGTYRVRVECWKSRSGYTDQTDESYVPEDFHLPDLVVPADATDVKYDIDVRTAK